MTPEVPDRVRALLAESLAVWRVGGSVAAGEPPVAAVVHGESTVVRVEIAAESENPIRWWVRWHDAGAAAGGAPRSRPCASVVGLLRAVRDALNVEGSRRLRIAPSAADA